MCASSCIQLGMLTKLMVEVSMPKPYSFSWQPFNQSIITHCSILTMYRTERDACRLNSNAEKSPSTTLCPHLLHPCPFWQLQHVNAPKCEHNRLEQVKGQFQDGICCRCEVTSVVNAFGTCSWRGLSRLRHECTILCVSCLSWYNKKKRKMYNLKAACINIGNKFLVHSKG